MHTDLRGRCALVCGASQGIGLAIAQALAARGAQVVLMARRHAALEAALTTLKQDSDQQHSLLVGDLNDYESLLPPLHALLHRHPIEICINNSAGPAPGSLLQADRDVLSQAFRQHVLASHALAQALVPGMRAVGYGRIINIISTSVKEPIPGIGVSNTIRGAMAAWAKTLATELGPDRITVNNVLPGYTETPRVAQIVEARAQAQGSTHEQVRAEMRQHVPLGRFAEPHEVAQAVAFLASPAAGYVNGINLPVDGGRTRSL